MYRFRSYPPAETKIPLSGFCGAILSRNGNFKRGLCKYLEVENCILGNSGRALLFLLLSTTKKDSPERNEVLIPGYTCYSVAAAVAKAGLTIRPYDLDPKTFFPDMKSLKQAVSGRTLAIVVQHLFGIPTLLDDIHTIGKETGAILIEDAAQALGGSMNGSMLGTQGDFALFSFGRGKPLPLGSGGALAGRDGSAVQAMEQLRHTSGILPYVGTVAAQWLSKPHFYGIAEMLPLGLGETIFDPGFLVSSLGPMMEKLGGRSLEFLAELNEHRTQIANAYSSVFGKDCTVGLAMKADPVYTRFPLLTEFRTISRELYSLGVRRMYPNAIADEETIKPYLADPQTRTPGASQIAKNLITLPTHMGISEHLAKEIAEKVKTHFGIA